LIYLVNLTVCGLENYRACLGFVENKILGFQNTLAKQMMMRFVPQYMLFSHLAPRPSQMLSLQSLLGD